MVIPRFGVIRGVFVPLFVILIIALKHDFGGHIIYFNGRNTCKSNFRKTLTN